MNDDNGFSTASAGLTFLRGTIAVIFGIIAIAWPGLTTATLILILGLYLIFDGIFDIIAGILGIGKQEKWGLVILKGILSMIVGVIVLNYQGLTLTIIAITFGILSIVKGVIEFIHLFQYRKEMDHKFLFSLVGIVDILFGLILVIHPLAVSVVYIWVIGLFALILGAVLIALSISMKIKKNKAKKASKK